MEIFRRMVNDCIKIGIENDQSALKRLSPLAYHQLTEYPIQSKYKLTAISQACGRLAQMKKDIKNGRRVRSPYVRKPYLVSCYGFKINGMLLSFPIRNREYVNILLNDHVTKVLSDPVLKIRSFTITPTGLPYPYKRRSNLSVWRKWSVWTGISETSHLGTTRK